MLTRLIAFFALTLLLPMAAMAAEDAEAYNRIQLSASAQTEVPQDTIVAMLYSQREGDSSSQLANIVNQQISWALEEATKEPAVRVQTMEYRTEPVYRQQILSAWRVRQSLRVESQDVEKLSSLLAVLQKQLALESVRYEISDSARRTAENQLIKEALGAFRERADLVTRELGFKSYRLVQLQLNPGNMPLPPRAMMMRQASMEAVAAPALDPGTQQVKVMVEGIIEMGVE
jgi:predicted secreted protein